MKTETKQEERQVKRLFDVLMTGVKVDRIFAWRRMGIADLRSRICNVESEFSVNIDRQTKAGKRYKEYFLTNPKRQR